MNITKVMVSFSNLSISGHQSSSWGSTFMPISCQVLLNLTYCPQIVAGTRLDNHRKPLKNVFNLI